MLTKSIYCGDNWEFQITQDDTGVSEIEELRDFINQHLVYKIDAEKQPEDGVGQTDNTNGPCPARLQSATRPAAGCRKRTLSKISKISMKESTQIIN